MIEFLLVFAVLRAPPRAFLESLPPRSTVLFDSLNTRFVGNWPFGYATRLDVDTVRKVAFVSSGGGVFILDISRPQTPVKMGEIRCRGNVTLVKYRDSILYLHPDIPLSQPKPEIERWDVRDPFRPTKLPNLPLRTFWGLEVRGRYLYVCNPDSFRIFDIGNPGPPVPLGTCPGYPASGITLTDTLAFVTLRRESPSDSGFRILSIADPRHPYEMGGWERRWVNALAVSGNFAYLTTDSELRVVDISDPANPNEVGVCRSPGTAGGIVVRDSYAFIADGPGGLTVVSVRDPANPCVVGNLNYPSAADIALVDSFACLISDFGCPPGFWVANIKNPPAPSYAGAYRLPGWSFAVAVAGDYAFLAEWETGVRVLDISDPTYPREVATFNIEYGSSGLAVKDSFLYCSETGAGLWILDISDPTRPVPLGFCPTPDGAEGVTVKDTLIFLAGGIKGLWVVSCANPRRPYLVGFYDTPGYARSVDVSDTLAYLADETGGLRIFSVANPAQPYELAALPISQIPVVVKVKDSLALLGGYYPGDLVLVDVKDPRHPRPIGVYHTYGPCWGVDVADRYAYVSDWFLVGFHIVDISTPSNPLQAGFGRTASSTYGIVYRAPYIYVATGWCGLEIFESLLSGVAERATPERVAGGGQTFTLYPNPAGSFFTLRSNRAAGAVRLYDTAGRLVKVCEPSGRGPGAVTVALDGVKDGVYFVQPAASGVYLKLLVKR